ncbi:hypothetical protein U1Q18_049972 [Sarracenia purpurea var. burkii]
MMTMKGMLIQQQNPAMEENISNLTSASGDQASVSSGNKAETGSTFPHQQYFAPIQTPPIAKKKRNLPGNPDPDAEVIALSPKTLMATNRFVCEICNKGFQRDQNLQLHRRGHNLPWKLKQRTSKEVRKKVYVCPEPSCVHHDPSRALGDLTGIKKHFCRKHGEKKWKCDKCSKRYAVQSDWKAHSKTCGTREYKCDCGTLFSRRDSFITHRAFCDALAEESTRAITGNPLLSSQSGTSKSHINVLQVQTPQFINSHNLQSFPIKKEQQNFINPRPELLPPWLACPPPVLGSGGGGCLVTPGPVPPPPPIDRSSSISMFSTRLDQDFTTQNHQDFAFNEVENPSPNPSLGPTSTFHPYHPAAAASPHMSATALLQKAAQMGATMCSRTYPSPPGPAMIMRPHQAHVLSADSGEYTAGFGHNLSSREERGSGFLYGLAPFCNKAAIPATTGIDTDARTGSPPSLLQDMMNSLSSGTGFVGSSFEDTFGGMLNSDKDGSFHDGAGGNGSCGGGGGGNGGRSGDGNAGMTRDFLGLRPLSHSDILTIAGLSSHVNSSQVNLNQNQTQKSWLG